MSTLVYVVMGQCGEYSDHREWGVRAFMDGSRAEDFAFQAMRRAREILKLVMEEDEDRYALPAKPEFVNEYDSNMELSYTGADYFVLKVPLETP